MQSCVILGVAQCGAPFTLFSLCDYFHRNLSIHEHALTTKMEKGSPRLYDPGMGMLLSRCGQRAHPMRFYSMTFSSES